MTETVWRPVFPQTQCRAGVCPGKGESGFPEKTNEHKYPLESVRFAMNLTDSNGFFCGEPGTGTSFMMETEQRGSFR